jgi:hypothetical protein
MLSSTVVHFTDRVQVGTEPPAWLSSVAVTWEDSFTAATSPWLVVSAPDVFPATCGAEAGLAAGAVIFASYWLPLLLLTMVALSPHRCRSEIRPKKKATANRSSTTPTVISLFLFF